jgi:hypothetical protein
MKLLVLTILFIGIIVIIQGYYMDKLEKSEDKKVITKYVPLHVYENQMSGTEMIDYQFKTSFEKITDI